MGSLATMGIIIGADFVLDSGATGDPPPVSWAPWWSGPLAAWLIMKVDQAFEDKVPVGFEMLYKQLLSRHSRRHSGHNRPMDHGSDHGRHRQLLRKCGGLVHRCRSPCHWRDIPIEVGKVLFLNNAINHGILGPLGAAEAAESGRSIYFLLETNPGPRSRVCCWPTGSPARGPGQAVLHPGAIVISLLRRNSRDLFSPTS